MFSDGSKGNIGKKRVHASEFAQVNQQDKKTKRKQAIIQSNWNVKKIKMRLNFTNIHSSVKYTCGGMLHIESLLNSYQTLSLKFKFVIFNGISRY